MSNYVTWGTHVYIRRELNVLVTSQHHRVQFHKRLRLLLSNKIDGETERNAEAERERERYNEANALETVTSIGVQSFTLLMRQTDRQTDCRLRYTRSVLSADRSPLSVRLSLSHYH